MLDTAFYAHDLLPALNRGLMVSLALIVPAASLGFVGGVLLGCARAFGPRWLRRLGNGYTSLVRGVPLVVQLMLIYYALPKVGIYFPPYGAALTSFILCTAAYQSEYIRGALLSIRQGADPGGPGSGLWRLADRGLDCGAPGGAARPARLRQ